ncbi:MAG: hypothetical protein B6242_09475 [Anaerolineaceae bacterium 4572_78]|nr:MAG: hypothetical protein B6242_09475 [Anaerolineaceae bacterium 4572_78]
MNPTDTQTSIDLEGIRYQDLAGEQVTGSIILEPFSAEILLYDGQDAPPITTTTPTPTVVSVTPSATSMPDSTPTVTTTPPTPTVSVTPSATSMSDSTPTVTTTPQVDEEFWIYLPLVLK